MRASHHLPLSRRSKDKLKDISSLKAECSCESIRFLAVTVVCETAAVAYGTAAAVGTAEHGNNVMIAM